MNTGRPKITLTDAQLKELGQMIDDGRINSDIAARFAIGMSTVVRLKKLIGKANIRPGYTRSGKKRPVAPKIAGKPASVAAVAEKCVNCRHIRPYEDAKGGMCLNPVLSKKLITRSMNGVRAIDTSAGYAVANIYVGWCCKFEEQNG